MYPSKGHFGKAGHLNDITGTARATGGLAIPDGDKQARMADKIATKLQIGFLGRSGGGQLESSLGEGVEPQEIALRSWGGEGFKVICLRHWNGNLKMGSRLDQQDVLNDELVGAFRERRKDYPGSAWIVLGNPFKNLVNIPGNVVKVGKKAVSADRNTQIFSR